jgi:tRNA nucleotidyltransferase/poly(A) polymerase
METYLVGGAVGGTLLGHPFVETDWVVVASTPEAMISAG